VKAFSSLLLAGAMALVCRDASAAPLGTSATFLNVQGVLHENGQPVNGSYWLEVALFTAPTGGIALAHDTNMNQVLVSNGLFTTTLDFGPLAVLGLSPTQDLYHQIDISPTGVPGSFTPLGPRQRIVPSMFATMAVRAEEARRLIEPLSVDMLPPFLPGLSFTGAPTFGVVFDAPMSVISSVVVANLNVDLLDGYDSSQFWKLQGNGGTTAGGNFIGTTDTNALEFKVNNTRALRLVPTASGPNVIAGGAANAINATIASSILGGNLNLIEQASYAVIGGGASNVVQNTTTNANYSSIGGGRGNHIGSGTPFATIPGGREGRAISYGQVAHASGGFGGQEGTAQESFYIVRGTTTNTDSTELFLDGATERIHVPTGSTWTYDVLVTARDAAAGSAGFQIRGMIGYNAGGNLVLLGTPITTPFFGVPAITAQVFPDNPNKAFTIKVTWGVANPNPVRWVATVRTAEVIY
jgi:hypothetical protein